MKSRQSIKVQDTIIKERIYKKARIWATVSLLTVASSAVLLNTTTVKAATDSTKSRVVVTPPDKPAAKNHQAPEIKADPNKDSPQNNGQTDNPTSSSNESGKPQTSKPDSGNDANKIYQYKYSLHTSEGEMPLEISGKANETVVVKVPVIEGKLPNQASFKAMFDENGKMTIDGEYSEGNVYVPIFITYSDADAPAEDMVPKGSEIKDTMVVVPSNMGDQYMNVSGKVGETKEFVAPDLSGYTPTNKVKVYFDADGAGTVLNSIYYQENNDFDNDDNLITSGVDGSSKYKLTKSGVLYFYDGTLDLKQTNDLFKTYQNDIKMVDTSRATDKVYAPENSSYLFGSKDSTMPALNISYNLSKFDTSKVTDMTGMFMQSQSPQQDTNQVLQYLGVSSFNTANVTNMKNMFRGINVSDLDLASFDTQKVTDMSGMFQNAIIQNYLDVSSFDMGNVKNMDNMLNMYLAPNQMVFGGGDDFTKATELNNKYADDRIYQNIGEGTGLAPEGKLIFNRLDGNYRDVLTQLKKTGKQTFVQVDGVVIKSNLGDKLVKVDPTIGTVRVPKVPGYTADKDIIDVTFIPEENVGLTDSVLYTKDPDYTIKVPGYFDDKKVGNFTLQKPLDQVTITKLTNGETVKVTLDKVQGQSDFGGKIIYGTTDQQVVFKNNELQLASGQEKVSANIIEADILIHYVKADTGKEITRDQISATFADNKKHQLHIKSLKELGKTIPGYGDIFDNAGKELAPIFVDDSNIQPQDLEQTVKIRRISGQGGSSTRPSAKPHENNHDNGSANIVKNDKTIATFSDKGIVRLYSVDGGATKLVANRGLAADSGWFSDEQITIKGVSYYRVATNEWVKASQVYEYKAHQTVVKTNDHTVFLTSAEGNAVSNRALSKDSAWKSDRYAKIAGSIYYRVATNEFVNKNDVTELE